MKVQKVKIVDKIELMYDQNQRKKIITENNLIFDWDIRAIRNQIYLYWDIQ